MTTTLDTYNTTFETLELTEAKQNSFQFFKENSFPTRRNEVYKNTKINHFRNLVPYTTFELPSETPNFFTHHYMESHLLVFVNGAYSSLLSNYTEEKGLHIYFDTVVNENIAIDDAFASLAKTFSDSRLTIKVDKNTVVSKPIVVINLAFNQGEDVLINMEYKVIVEENAQVEILEDYLNPSTTNFNLNTYTTYEVAKNANLYLNIYQEEENFYFIGNKVFNQHRDSNVFITNPILNGNLVRNYYVANILGENAHCEINGFFMNENKTHTDTRIRINHMAPSCTSNQLFRGVMNDESVGVFNGKVYVAQAAQKTNAYQSNKNLVLSDDATIYTKPELEIYADDVKCSHGATTGQLDEEAIFYCMQRGIPKENAKSLITYAFTQEALRDMKNEDIKHFFEERLTLKMGL
tara:strand:+ start:2359 stop:3582 length:1224 start_codon:yes stop_codon:yes gene_type:complete